MLEEHYCWFISSSSFCGQLWHQDAVFSLEVLFQACLWLKLKAELTSREFWLNLNWRQLRLEIISKATTCLLKYFIVDYWAGGGGRVSNRFIYYSEEKISLPFSAPKVCRFSDICIVYFWDPKGSCVFLAFDWLWASRWRSE